MTPWTEPRTTTRTALAALLVLAAAACGSPNDTPAAAAAAAPTAPEVDDPIAGSVAASEAAPPARKKFKASATAALVQDGTDASAAAANEVVLNVYKDPATGVYAAGWYNPGHTKGNTFYLVGPHDRTTAFRSFFSFDLSGVSGKISAATIVAVNGCGSGDSGTMRLYDVSTSLASLIGGGTHSDYWQDLGSGTVLGSVDVTDTLAPSISIPLNADGLAALQAQAGSGVVTFGGDYQGGTSSDYLLGCNSAGSAGENVQLHLAFGGGDVIAPVVVAPQGTVTAEAACSSGAVVTYDVRATDDTDGAVPASCSIASGSVFPLGSTLVQCSAKDAAGNVGTASFTVVVRDSTGPTLALPRDLTAEATGAAGAAVMYDAGAADAVDGVVPATCVPASGSTFSLGTTLVSCTASDLHGNASAGTFRVTVSDTSAPVFTSSPGNRTAEATGPEGAAVAWALPTAADLVDGITPVLCDHDSGAVYPVGITAVVCTSSDAQGNVARLAFAVGVTDTTPPVLALPSNVVATAVADWGAAVAYSAAAQDLVDGLVPADCTPASASVFPIGTTTVTCTATDLSGNTATGSFDVRVTVGFEGFLPPLKTDGTPVFKLGRTVPVKFRLSGDSASLGTLQARLYATSMEKSVAMDGVVFRYQNGLYHANLDTKPLSVGTWLLVVKLGDGVLHTQPIELR